MDHRKHDAHVTARIRHAGVPEAEVADDDASLLDDRLGLSAEFLALREHVLSNAAAGPLTVRALLRVDTAFVAVCP